MLTPNTSVCVSCQPLIASSEPQAGLSETFAAGRPSTATAQTLTTEVCTDPLQLAAALAATAVLSVQLWRHQALGATG